MKRTSFAQVNCSLAQTLEVIGDWWTLMIVRDAFFGTTRFEAFQQDLGIARNILTQRLKHLVEQGVLERRPLAEGRRQCEYLLTEKGRDLLPVLLATTQWGDKWAPNRRGKRVVFVEAATGRPIATLAPRTARGKPLRMEEIEPRAGPGASPEAKARFSRYRPS